MSTVSVNVTLPQSGLLDRIAAARHVGFLPSVFDQWVDAGLLPGPSIDGQFWTAADLNSALDRLSKYGFQPHTRIPNIQRQRRTDTLGVKKIHHYRRGTPGALPGEPGSPEFMRALIAKERAFAAAHPEPAEAAYAAQLATQPIDTVTDRPKSSSASSPAPSSTPSSAPSPALPPPGKSAQDIIAKARIPSPAPPRERLRQVENQPAPPAQPSSVVDLITTESVTQPAPAEAAPMPPTAQEIIAKARVPATSASPTQRLFRTRRRAAVTQAEIARIIRAAKQAGAAEVELRLSDSASVIVRLQPDNSIASDDKEIIL